ncbi:MAG: hypothetical protein AAFP04_03940 [Myxococcota bacterium]
MSGDNDRRGGPSRLLLEIEPNGLAEGNGASGIVAPVDLAFTDPTTRQVETQSRPKGSDCVVPRCFERQRVGGGATPANECATKRTVIPKSRATKPTEYSPRCVASATAFVISGSGSSASRSSRRKLRWT